jgi:SAM-dependent methyltransferase
VEPTAGVHSLAAAAHRSVGPQDREIVMPDERKDTWAAGKLYEPYVGRWSRLVAKDFLRWLELPAQLDWLDVGCGTGALTEVILQQARPISVIGMDSSAGFVDHAKAHNSDPRATFEVADAQSLTVDSARFDAAVADLVLNFVPKPLLAVQEMARAVRPGGVVAAYVWDYAGKMELMRYFWTRRWHWIEMHSNSMKGAAFRFANQLLWLRCSLNRGCAMSRCGRSMSPPHFGTSMTTGPRSWVVKHPRPVTQCH